MRSYQWAQRLLHIAQVEPNQSVSKKHRGDSASAAKPMDGRFADLQDLSQLAGGQIVGAFVFWLFRRIRLYGFRLCLLAISWQFISSPVQVKMLTEQLRSRSRRPLWFPACSR